VKFSFILIFYGNSCIYYYVYSPSFFKHDIKIRALKFCEMWNVRLFITTPPSSHVKLLLSPFAVCWYQFQKKIYLKKYSHPSKR